MDSSAARLASNGYTHYLYIVLFSTFSRARMKRTSSFPFPSFAIVNSIPVSLAVDSMISVVSFCTSSFSSSSSFDP